MKILLCHTHYRQLGGEDHSFLAEADLLEQKGHDVVRFTMHNNAIEKMGRGEAARRTIWNRHSYRKLRALIQRERPSVMHCTNTFPLMSPAVYYAARAEGVAVVQSLRNYRLLCPNGLFLRRDRVCENCLGKSFPWPGLVHACYRESRAATAVTATMLAVHRAMKTWTRTVNRYVALTEFSRQKFIKGGISPERIAIKPNFVDPDPGPGSGRGNYAVFVGRLSREKGIDTLLSAWERIEDHTALRAYPRTRLGVSSGRESRDNQAVLGRVLKVIGDGPLASRVVSAAERRHNIQWLGKMPTDEILPIIGNAQCLILPSLCYENFPRTIVEAFSKGTPVVASRLGAMAELVDAGRTGLHFDPGDAADLASKVCQLLVDTPTRTRMRREARREYEQKYTAARNYDALMAVYRRAREAASLIPGQDPLAAGSGDVEQHKGPAPPTQRIDCLPAHSETG